MKFLLLLTLLLIQSRKQILQLQNNSKRLLGNFRETGYYKNIRRNKTMANQIRITPDQMRERANQYRTEADTVNGVINKMDSLLQQLQSEWEGSASESYAARYQELKPGFMKAEELIREIAAALDSTAKIVEETDSEIANQFRA